MEYGLVQDYVHFINQECILIDGITMDVLCKQFNMAYFVTNYLKRRAPYTTIAIEIIAKDYPTVWIYRAYSYE